MRILLIIFVLWVWTQLIVAGYYLRRAQGKRLYVFDPISLAIYVGITLVTASIQARLNRKSLKDFQGIPTNDETRPVQYFAGSVEISAPALLDFGDFNRSKVTIAESLPGFLGFLASMLLILKFLPIGYRYYCGFDFGFGHGPNVVLKGIRIADKQVYTGSLAGGTGVIAAPGVFGLEGGTYGVFDFYPGSPTQLSNAYWASQHTRVPAYRGYSHLVFRGPSSGDPPLGDIKFSGYVGRTPILREWKFQLMRIPDNLGVSEFATINGNEANPAEVIYELYTLEALGIGAPSSMFDLPAWQAAAEVFFDEGMGVDPVWDNSSTVGDVINHIRDTVDCMIFSSLEGANAGKLTIKLIRDDYDVDDLIEVTPENASDVVKFTNRTVDDVPNEIKVSYVDINAGYVKGEAIWQSMANRQLGETRNTIEADYPVGNGTTASKLATRDGLATVLPLKDVQLKANRQTSRLGPGSVFKFAWPDYDVQRIILRVNNITLGNLEEPTVILECIEDRFSLGESAYGSISTRIWVEPTAPEPQDNLIHTVINQTTTTPPGSPSVGDSYIVATGGTGAWSAKDGCLATWIQAGEWQYECGADLAYTVVYDADTQTLVANDGSTWSEIITTSYKTIQEEGTPLVRRETINFIGAGVTAADDAGNNRTNVTIASTALTVQDEGSNLTQRQTLNFIGDGVTAVDNAGSTRTDVTIPGAASTSPGGSDTQFQYNDAGVFAGASGLIYIKATNTISLPVGVLKITTNRLDIESTSTFGATGEFLRMGDNGSGFLSIFPGGLVYTQPSISQNQPVIATAGTWNNAGIIFQNIKTNITDTASPTQATLIELQVGGTPKFLVYKSGIIQSGGTTRVSAQFDKTNTTLANVTGLTNTLAHSKTYGFRARLYYDADATGGAQFAIGGTATASAIVYQINAICNASNAFVINSRQTALAGSAGQAGCVAGCVEITGTITTTASTGGGTLTVQFAQNAANGTSSILIGSTFEVTEIL